MKKTFLIIIGLLVFFCFFLHASGTGESNHYFINGQIKNRDGRSVPSVWVILLSYDGKMVGRTLVDDNGKYSLQVNNKGSYEIIVSRENEQTQNPFYRHTINLTGDIEYNIVIETR